MIAINVVLIIGISLSIVVSIVIMVIEKKTGLTCPKCFKENYSIIDCENKDVNEDDIEKVKKQKFKYTFKCNECGTTWCKNQKHIK